jgi:ascorbate-specific PTS system EIIC-type component UlaA
MAVLALTAWAVTALAGLYLLAIWLIEYDPDFQHAAATRLPVLVVCGHVLFAVAGLLSWVMYLITAKRIYSWTTVGALALIATLGLTMAWRWLGV